VATRRGIIVGAVAASVMALGGAAAPLDAPAPVPRPATAAPEPKTGAEIRRALGLTGRSGWILWDLDQGVLLDGHAIDAAFAPASVAKLATALFALDRLGPGHRFETRLLATGPIAEEVLAGDLILAGGGDPELDTDALLGLVQKARGAGLGRVEGEFLVDGTAFLQTPAIDPEQPVEVAYNPAVSGLNLNFNRVRLKWTGRGRDAGISVTAKAAGLAPAVEGVRVVPTRGGPPYAHEATARGETWHINRGGFRRRGARWLPVKHPERYAGEVFAGLAETNDIALGAPRLAPLPEGARVLVRHRGRPLTAVLRGMLRYSTNLTAETLGVAATRAGGIAPATLAESAAMMNDWAALAIGAMPADPRIAFANHSGLSADSRVSPSAIIGLLVGPGRRLAPGLPAHPRLPGTIAGVLKPYRLAKIDPALDADTLEIRAKTGTMDFIRGLAGYIATPKGRRLAFAIFSNDLARRDGASRRLDRRWLGRAKAFERALIGSWLLRFDSAVGDRG